MKRSKLTLLLVLFCSLNAFSQSQIGAYYLPESTSILNTVPSSDPIVKDRLTFAGGGGVNYTYNFSSKFAIQTGLQYTSHNQKFTSTYQEGGIDNTYKGKKRLDYLTMPVLLKYSWRLNSRISYTYSAGAQLSYLTKGAGAVVVYKHVAPGYDYFDLPPSSAADYNRFILAGVVAAGMDYRLDKRITLNAALRASYSLFTNVENTNAIYTYEGKGAATPLYSVGTPNPPKAHNLAIGLQMGLTYDIGNNSLVCPSDKWK